MTPIASQLVLRNTQSSPNPFVQTRTLTNATLETSLHLLCIITRFLFIKVRFTSVMRNTVMLPQVFHRNSGI